MDETALEEVKQATELPVVTSEVIAESAVQAFFALRKIADYTRGTEINQLAEQAIQLVRPIMNAYHGQDNGSN